MAGERLQRLDGRVRIRGFRIIIVFDAVDFCKVFNAVLDADELLKHGLHGLGIAARKIRHRRCGQRILDVVRPLDAKLVHRDERNGLSIPAQRQHVAIEHHALVEILRATEIADADACGHAVLHAAHAFVVIVQHDEVAIALMRENPLLHGLIDIHRAVADDVVGRDIQHG